MFVLLTRSELAPAEGYCPCKKHEKLCFPECCCDTDCGYSSTNFTCFKSDVQNKLPKCPHQAFQNGEESIDEWLVNEIVCETKDNRNIVDTTYSNNFVYKYSNEEETESQQNQQYTFGDALKDESGAFYKIGDQIISFLSPVSHILFDTLPTFPNVLPYPGANSTDAIAVNGTTTHYTIIHFTISSSSNFVIESVEAIGIPDSATPPATYDVSVYFVFADQADDPTTIRSPRGYTRRQPILYKDGSDVDSTNVTSFLMPFGNQYVPLLFGVDILIPDKTGSIAAQMTNGNFSKYGYVNTGSEKDWISIDFPNNGNRCKIYTRKDGTIHNPIYSIAHISCTTGGNTNVFSVTWLEVKQSVNRYIWRHPNILPYLPDDIFYPFDRKADA